MATSTPTPTPSATGSGENTKRALEIFFPIAIGTAFLLIVVVAFMWWIFGRIDRKRQSIKSKGCQQAEAKEDLENRSDDELALPTYKAKDNEDLPPYGTAGSSVTDQTSDGGSQQANGRVESAS